MLRSHINRITKSKVSVGIFVLMVLIPVWDACQLFVEYLRLGGDKWHPAFAFFLAGSSIGHIPQYILLWFLPLFLLVIGTDDALQDYKTGYHHAIVSRIGLRSYLKEKLVFSFFTGFFVMLFVLLVNFILVSILFYGGIYAKGLNEITFESDFINYTIEHPYFGVFLYSLLACLLAGLAGMLGSACSLFFKDRKYTYAATFFLWFIFVMQENSSMHIIQPFTEYGWLDIAPALLVISASYILISAVVYFYEVKKNEPI
ncbi:hypothetical protein SFC02_12805 [Terribacillus goriensis]|uniref:hypothetical protein n=1 Tax=Terribacillus saccharophilus TaxID=361277 RepID=UPI00398315B6